MNDSPTPGQLDHPGLPVAPPRREPGRALAAAHPVALIDDWWAPTLAFAGSLGRRGVPLHLYGRGAGRLSRYCERHLPCPPVLEADTFLPWLQARVRAGEIRRLAPTTDHLAYYLALLRDDFPLDVRRTIATTEEIVRCLVKPRFYAACEAADQAVPLTAAPDSLEGAVLAARELGYPLMLKPKSHLVVGHAERGELVHDERMLRSAFRRYEVAPGQALLAASFPELRWPLLQRYIPSARHSVFSISGIKDADTGILTAVLTRKLDQWPPHVGVSTVQSSCDDRRVLDAGLRAVDRLVSRGIFELELLTDGERLLAIDLNPRAFGFITLDIALGNDLPWLWWQTTLGAVPPMPLPTSLPALECRFAVPYYIGVGIRRLFGPRSGGDARPATAGAARWVSMLGLRGDPLPMWAANLRLLRHPGGLVRPYLRALRQAG